MRLLVERWWGISAKQLIYIRPVSEFFHDSFGYRVYWSTTVVDADPTHNEAKMKLAELYEILDEPRKALDLVYQGKQHAD